MFEELMPKKHPKQEAVDKGFKDKEKELRKWIDEDKNKNKRPSTPPTIH